MSLSVVHNQDESIFHFKLNKLSSSNSNDDQILSSFEWSILRVDTCGEWSGPLYYDFLSRNAMFLREHLTHYPPQAFTDLSFSINKMKVLSSPHNFFVFVKDPHHTFYEEFVVKKNTEHSTVSSEPLDYCGNNHDQKELHMFLREHKIIGICGGKPNDGERMEVGYALDEAFQSHGIVTNTLRVLIERAFRTVETLQEIEIVCLASNLRSSQVAHRLNFVLNDEKSKKASLKENCNLQVYVLKRSY